MKWCVAEDYYFCILPKLPSGSFIFSAIILLVGLAEYITIKLFYCQLTWNSTCRLVVQGLQFLR